MLDKREGGEEKEGRWIREKGVSERVDGLLREGGRERVLWSGFERG